jgi:hypothetical protein
MKDHITAFQGIGCLGEVQMELEVFIFDEEPGTKTFKNPKGDQRGVVAPERYTKSCSPYEIAR